MNYIKTYEEYINESVNVNPDVTALEKILKLPLNSGVFQSVNYNTKDHTLEIKQPLNISPIDAGAVISSIQKEKSNLKKNYSGLKNVMIDDIKLTL